MKNKSRVSVFNTGLHKDSFEAGRNVRNHLLGGYVLSCDPFREINEAISILLQTMRTRLKADMLAVSAELYGVKIARNQ